MVATERNKIYFCYQLLTFLLEAYYSSEYLLSKESCFLIFLINEKKIYMNFSTNITEMYSIT